MAKKTAGKKVRDILFGVLSFFLSLFLFMLSLGVVGEISLFNKSFWIDQMNSTNYFVDKCDEMTDRLVILGYASGLSKDFCEKIVDPIMITTDTETYLDDFFEGGTGRVDTTAFKQKFISELESYIKEKNAKVDQSNVDYLVKNAESRYKDCVKIPLLTQIAGYFHAVKKYLPYMVCVYEGGMMAYPLYTSLCGSEHLSQIAVLDIAGLLFGFSVYMGMLGQTENGGKISAKALFFSAVKTPAFVASVLGIAAGLTGIISRLVESSFGGVYLSVENILTTSVTSMILLVVGYSMELTRELIRPCIKTIVLRVCVQAVMMAGVLLAVHFLIGSSQLMDLAIILYMSAPATFSMQTFLKKKESSAYVSTTNSLYCIVSILVYMVLALIIY